MPLKKDRYYTRGYFTGKNSDSPYPKNGRYMDVHHPLTERKFNDLLQLLLEMKNRGKILDMGCGPAHMEKVSKKAKKRFRFFNFDVAKDVVKMAKESGASNLLVADLRHLPYKKSSFDCALMFDVIEHVSEDDAMLSIRESSRILKRSGVVFIRTPNKYTWTDYYRRDKGHLWFPSTWSLGKILRASSFRGINATTRGFPTSDIYQKIWKKDLRLPFLGSTILVRAVKSSSK